MTPKAFLIIAGAAAVSVTLAAFSTLSAPSRVAAVPERLFPGLYNAGDDIATISIRTGDTDIVLRRAEDSTAGDWLIAEPFGGYPADAEQVTAVLRALAELSPLEAKTALPEQHERLGVEPVPDTIDDRDPATLRVTFANAAGEPIADLIAGDRTNLGRRFVRAASEDQTWLSSEGIELPRIPIQFVERPLIQMNASRIRSVTIEHPGEDAFTIIRDENAPSTAFVLSEIPAGFELAEGAAGTIRAVSNAIGFVSCTVITPLTGEDNPINDADAVRVRIETTDDIAFEMRLNRIDQRGAWVSIEPSSAAAEGEPPAADLAELTRKLSGYAFRMQGTLVDNLTTKRSDLLESATPESLTPVGPVPPLE
ncbi:MAG: DUF4340 domain-containing protein [Planctomycetota bacterium]